MHNLASNSLEVGLCRRAMSLDVAQHIEADEAVSPPSSDNMSLPVDVRQKDERVRLLPCAEVGSRGHEPSTPLSAVETFVPGLVTHSLTQPTQPIQRELAIVFVDIADSTRTIVRQPLEAALVIVQRFTRLVTEIALAHCGDVKDYEGDGAMLYFGSVEQAAKAALAIRAALVVTEEKEEFSLRARLSINVGGVIIGEIGSPMRRSVTLIGPMIHVAARLLKHIPPGGIIAPQAVVERLRHEAPETASQFHLLGPCLVLRGFEEECITAYHVPPPDLAT